MFGMVSDVECWLVLFGSLLAAGMLTPGVMRLAVKVGAIDRGGYRKVAEREMPLMGGLAVAAPFVILCLLGYAGLVCSSKIEAPQINAFLVLGIGGVCIAALGVVDDIRGLRARTKLVIQTLVAIFVCIGYGGIQHVNLPLVEGEVNLGPVVGAMITVFWIVGLTNAFNLIDGIDGLATGVGLIASLGLAIIAAQNGNTFVSVLSLSLTGALLAFLAFNFHPAKVFLGDTGSMFLGFSLACIAMMGSVKSQATVIFLAPFLALGLPICETLISVLRRFVRGRPLFVGDQYHTHHRLLNKGFSQRQAAALLYAVTLLFVVAAILYQVLHRRWIPIALYAITVLGLAWVAGYIRPKEAMQRSKRRRRNLLLSSLSRYVSQSLSSGCSALGPVEILRIARREMKLCFMEVARDDGHVLVSSGRLRLHPNGAETNMHDEVPSLFLRNSSAETAEKTRLLEEALDEIAVPASDGRKLIVRFQLYGKRDDHLEYQDIVACIAGIFEHFSYDALSRPARPIYHSYEQRSEVITYDRNPSPDGVSA